MQACEMLEEPKEDIWSPGGTCTGSMWTRHKVRSRHNVEHQKVTCRTGFAMNRLCCRATRALALFVWHTLTLQDLHGMPVSDLLLDHLLA